MNHMSSSPRTTTLLQQILNGSAYAVSNGSFFLDYKLGATAWIDATTDGEEWIQGGGLVLGSPDDQDPYHSELGGLLGIAAFFSGWTLAQTHHPSITVAGDRKSALS